MTTLPQISVVMPVWQPSPEYFPVAVQSILEQTLQDIELIIVEDPSPATSSVAANFSDPRIRYVLNTHRTSLFEQLNQGFERASAPWVARMDADDVAHPQRLEKQLAMVTSRPDIDVLGTQVRLLDQHGEFLCNVERPLDHESIVKTLRRYNPIAHPSVLIRKSAFDAAGAYCNFEAAEDYELWCRMASSGYHFANHPGFLLSYRLHPSSIKSTRIRTALKSTAAIKKRYWGNSLSLPERTHLLAEQLLGLAPMRVIVALNNRKIRARIRKQTPQIL